MFAAGPIEDFGEPVGRSYISDPVVHGSTMPTTSKPSSGSTKAGLLQQHSGGNFIGTNLLNGTQGVQLPKVRSVERLSTNQAELILVGPSRKQKIHTRKQANPIDDLFDGLQ